MSCGCAGALSCGACAGITQRTPQMVANRSGLSAIAYRSGRQPDFFASLVAGLSSAARPALGALRTRETDDATIALLDAFSCVCDVLTFYTERLANEAYLRTAVDATSLQELGRLVGYRPAPGAAAQTYLAFTLERPPTLPSALAADPGLVPPTVPAAVTLPIGLRVMSVPGPGETPVTFETVDAVDARPEWNSVPATRTTPYGPQQGRTDAWLKGTPTLKIGDTVLFAGDDTGSTGYGAAGRGDDVVETWDARVLTDVEPDPADGRTHVMWSPGLGSVSPPKDPSPDPVVSVLRTIAGVFGATAPAWASLSTDAQNQYHPPPGTTDWPGFDAVGSDGGIDIEGSRPELVAGSLVLLDTGGDRDLYRVQSRREAARAGFGISGRVTRLQLAGPPLPAATPRGVTVYGGGQPLTLVDAPDPTPVPAGSTTLGVTGDLSAMRPGRVLVVSGTTVDGVAAAETVTLASGPTTSGPVSQLSFVDPLQRSYQRASVVVFGNVANATHGATVSQLLGDGDATVTGQGFTVQATPVTYTKAPTATGTASTLQVSVDGLTWAEVPTAYPAGPTDLVFTTGLDASGRTRIVFGDGVHGARLPTGSQNVRARYRQGLGLAGNVRRNVLSQPLDRPLGLKALTNPVAATGGVDAAGPDAARASIPLGARTLGRVVSVADYADLALAFTGVAKAAATVLSLPAGPTVTVTVAATTGDVPPASTLIDLAAALHTTGDPYVALAVVAHRPQTFRIAARVELGAGHQAADVLPAVEQAWRDAFAFAVRDLGAPVFASDVITVAQLVSGVVGVELDRLYVTGDPPASQARLIAPGAMIGPGGDALGAALLSLDPAPLDGLEQRT